MTPPADCTACMACMDYVRAQPGLIGACASVGISRGLDTGVMLARYLDGFHQRGHTRTAEPAQQQGDDRA